MNYSASQKIVLPIVFLVMLAIAIAFYFIFKNKSNKQKNIPLFIIGILLLCLEIGKQIYYIFFTEYITYALPFHFCTLVIFLIPLSHLFGEKFGNFFRPLAFTFSGLITAILYIAPTATIGNSIDHLFENYYFFHTFTFHHLVVLYFMLSISLQLYKPKIKDCIKVVCGILFYCLYAVPIAFKLNTNYVNILHSPVAFLENIRLNYGQFLYDFIWFSFSTLCACAILITYYFVLKLIKKIQAKKKGYQNSNFLSE